MTDKFIHYEERCQQVRKEGEKIYHYLNDKVYSPLRKNLYIIIDEAKDIVQVFIHILFDQQEKMASYIRSNYKNIQVIVSENWMRLDFN